MYELYEECTKDFCDEDIHVWIPVPKNGRRICQMIHRTLPNSWECWTALKGDHSARLFKIVAPSGMYDIVAYEGGSDVDFVVGPFEDTVRKMRRFRIW